MGEVSSGDRVNWPSVVMLCVTLAIAFVWIANQVEARAACEDARATAASAGPWTYDASEPSDVVIWGKPDPSNPEHADGAFLANVGASRFGQVGVAFDIDEANGRFIAAARSDVPALVARVRELEARIERARRCCNCPALDGAGDDNG